jgi:rare lipoprotein A
VAAAVGVALALVGAVPAFAQTGTSQPSSLQEAQRLNAEPAVREPPGSHPPLDRSGRRLQGKASFYAHTQDGLMANGHRFDPTKPVAASKSLPFGTVVKVTNLKNGKSVLVKVEDRGPYIAGRIVDLTPPSAAKLGMTEEGVAPVIVAPVAVPQPDGAVKAGAGAAEMPPSTAAKMIDEAAAGRVPTEPAELDASR